MRGICYLPLGLGAVCNNPAKICSTIVLCAEPVLLVFLSLQALTLTSLKTLRESTLNVFLSLFLKFFFILSLCVFVALLGGCGAKDFSLNSSSHLQISVFHLYLYNYQNLYSSDNALIAFSFPCCRNKGNK